MIRQTTMELDSYNGGARGVLDVHRLGIWVRFQATIEERQTAHGPQPVVSKLEAKDDDGALVPVGASEHGSIVVLFLQAYYRWRRRCGSTSTFGHG